MNEWDWNAVGTHVNFYKGERVLSVTEAAEELNTLTRELAEAKAKIEKALEHIYNEEINEMVSLVRVERTLSGKRELRKSED